MPSEGLNTSGTTRRARERAGRPDSTVCAASVGPHARVRVMAISADLGAGHDTAALELTGRLVDRGFQVEHVNFLSLLPWPLSRMVKRLYCGLLRWLPWGYGFLFAITSRSRLSVRLLRVLLQPVRNRILRRIPPDTGAIVSTYPFANQLLGPLRQQQRLTVPVISYITDFSVHPTWISPGIDVYCTVHQSGLAQARGSGAVDVRLVQPLISARFGPSAGLSRERARRRFGLPRNERLALIVAGSWGIGEVAATAAEVSATGCALPVVVCGRSEALYRRLRRSPWPVFGWVDDMPALMRAADVLVENAGGQTCQEALAAGLPVITYRPIAGHGRANAAIMARSQLTRWVLSAEQLPAALDALIASSGGRTATTRSASDPPKPPGIDPATLVADTAADSAWLT